jgi:hypothetical protein
MLGVMLFVRAIISASVDMNSIGFASSSSNERHPKLKDISFTPRQCPSRNSYTGSCMAEAMNETIRNPNMQVESVPDIFLPRLLNFFHGKKVALVGDSLTRQWFETLSCRLGMTPQWFRRTSTPQRLVRAKEAGVEFRNLKILPFGMWSALGYAISTTAPNTLFNLRRQEPLSTTLEYFLMKRIHGQNATKMLDFLAQESNIIIVNLGIHYRTTEDLQFQYHQDLQEILTACGALNQRRRQSSKSTAYCIFREAFPQHTQPLHGDDFPDDWVFDINDVDREAGCGPFHPNVNPSLFQNASYLYHFADSFQVPVIRVLDSLRNAWGWHPGRDCSHYCQDNMLWDVVHNRLLETAVEYGFY